jgi:hypothetical protein
MSQRADGQILGRAVVPRTLLETPRSYTCGSNYEQAAFWPEDEIAFDERPSRGKT